ncbi:hypothetical protein BGAL_0106g00150 [Botrytis galanthina]|uniref:Uncharacterized protein n=1 Tax=Botrytis galanthina TaxID=278940 RepID=A0A4S8R5T7_9HELO|nr:hypothetical protein BGAL_0106g00150 [Botrytis galanthina]
MITQWSTTSSGPWDEKYPQLDTGNSGPPPPIPTEPIVYPENFGGPFIMKPISHSWADVSEMILHCVRRSQTIKYHPAWDQLLQLYQSITYIKDRETVLTIYKNIYNEMFFGGMVKSSVVEESADDEIKIIFDLELVSNLERARAVNLDLDNGSGPNLGRAEANFEHGINRVTIYILDVVTSHPETDCHKAISQMLGTLAHEMIHAMQFMYAKHPDDGPGIMYATHGTNFQKAAQAIEQATRDPSGGDGWIFPKIELGRNWAVVCDILDENFKEPTDAEIRNMGSDVEELRGMFLEHLPARSDEIDQLDNSHDPTSAHP